MAIESNASKNHAVQMMSRIFRCHEQYGSRSSLATTWRMSPRTPEAAMSVMVFPPVPCVFRADCFRANDDTHPNWRCEREKLTPLDVYCQAAVSAAGPADTPP